MSPSYAARAVPTPAPLPASPLPAQTAAEWTADLAAALLQPLNPQARALLDRVPWVSADPDPVLAGAALMARLASDYTYNDTPDTLISRLVAASGLDHDGAHDLVIIATWLVRAGVLPGPRWWQPFLLAEQLAVAWGRALASAGEDPAVLLAERLWLAGPLLDATVELTRYPADVRFEADLPGLAQPIADSAAFLADVDGRADLAATAAELDRVSAYYHAAESADEAEREVVVERELDRFGVAAAGLTRLEFELLKPLDDDDRLLMRAADLARRFVVVTAGEGPSPLPDLVNGQRALPRKLNLLLGIGMHSYQQRAGPIISWLVVFDGALPVTDELALRLMLDEDEDHNDDDATPPSTDFRLQFDIDGEPLNAPLHYVAGSATDTLSLAVLVLVLAVRIDVYARDRNRGFRHLAQRAIVLKEPMLAEVRTRALARCRELFADGEHAARSRVDAELRGDPAEQAAIGFLMLDWGKSEQLIEASAPDAALGPYRTATSQQRAALATARRTALRTEADRIERPSPEAEDRASAASQAYITLVEETRVEVRGGGDGPDRAGRLREITARTVTPARAIAQIAFGSQGLEVITAARDDDGLLRLDRLELPVDADELALAVSADDGSAVALIDRRGGAGAELGARLADLAERLAIDELVICPTRFLHRLPFHALPIGNGERLLDRADILYAPSAAILDRLAQTPARAGGTLIAAHALLHAPDEAAVVGALTDAPAALQGGAATASALLAALPHARRLHVCSHGIYLPDDILGSHLLLASDADGIDRLSVARILADADVAGMDLAVLGACLSGSGQNLGAAADTPAGIDSALLAAGVRNVVSAIWTIDDLAALLFHTQLYLELSTGARLMDAYRDAVDLLRTGDWRNVADSPLGDMLELLGVDLDAAFADLASGDDDDGPTAENFANLEHWTAYRVCGLGQLAGEPPRS
jgi:CHAT domain-containing protein